MLKSFILVIIFCLLYTKAEVTLEYTEEGVLRKDGNCDITFVNFGIEKTITGQSVKKTLDKNTGTFNITLSGLINGNIGLNYETVFELEDLYKYIKVTQDNETLTTVSFPSMKNGKFDLVIYDVVRCEGLTIKQTFKDETVTVANRLYYVNVVPETINRAFDSNLFGPSLSYPFERIHWKMNEGLDDLRKTCGIYIKYDKFVGSNGNHWQYYLSVESVNSKQCNQREFFEVIKRNYIDYHFTRDLLGDNYMGYVFKREGHIEVHMDGVIVDNHYLVEIYQKSCNDQFESQTICTLPSDDAFSFRNFTEKLTKECLGINELTDEMPEWTIASDGKSATANLKNQIITIVNSDRGSLPKKVDENLKYKTFSAKESTPIARFVISLTCGNGSFLTDTCQCQVCPENCESCTNAETCTVCANGRKLNEKGKCECKENYFEDALTKQCVACKSECGTCNSKDSCTSCKDSTATLSDGTCVCNTSFLNSEGFCHQCDESCATCDEFGCVTCSDPTKIPNEEGKCI